jgi:hypothetical protein
LDFAAYSRATGTPYPEDPEERAQLAPEVAEFRRNQIRQPQESSNLLETLGTAALGLGTLVGAGLVGRRMLRGGGAKATSASPGTQLTKIPTGAVEQIRREGVPAPVAPSKVAAIPQATVNLQSFSTEIPTRANQPGSFTDLTDIQNRLLNQTRNQQANSFESGEDQMTGRMRQQLQRNEDLDLSSIDAAEDLEKRSQYLKFKQTLEPDSAINAVAAAIPDGIPVDQAEGLTSAQRFLERERMEIASQLGEQNLPITPSRIEEELANRLGKGAFNYGPSYTARRQNLELFAQTGSKPLLENVQRFGLSPVKFETFENMPAAKRAGFESAAPFTTSYYPDEEIVARGLSSKIEVDVPGMGRVNIAELRKPVIMEQTALAAEDYYQTKKGEALDWLGNLRVQLEPKRNQILKERRVLAEQSAEQLLPQLEQAKNAGQRELAADLEGQLQVLRNLWRNPELGSHREDEMRLLNARISNAQKEIAESIAGIQKKYPTTIENWSGEANRVFGELDVETGEFIPETMELRSERKMVDLTPKGGGGRNIGEYTAGERLDEEIRAIQGGGRVRDYDPETGEAVSPWSGDRTQTGRELGIYGVRLSKDPADNPELRPTDVLIPKAGLSSPYSNLDDETLGQLSMMGSVADRYNAEKEIARRKVAGETIQLGGIQSTSEPLVQLPTESARRSVLMSEAVLKAARQQAARNPRGGVLPDELTQLRMQMAQMQPPAEPKFTRRPPGPKPGAVPPQQLALKGVSGYKARQVKSPADEAAEQLKAYMSKLQRGRATPLTSEAVIQPRLF